MWSWFQFHLFVSYSHVDGEFVKTLVRALTPEFKVSYDEGSVIPGKDYRKQIEALIARSDAGLVVLSPDAVESGAVDTELTALLSRSWKLGKPLIPILYRSCQIPLLLESFQYVDFRDQSTAAHEESLLKLRKALHGQPPGIPGSLPTVHFPSRRTVSLLMVLVALLLFLALPTFVKGVWSYVEQRRDNELRYRTQRDVQKIEDLLNVSPYVRAGPLVSGERTYPDPINDDGLIKDVWTDGRLVFRMFLRGGRLVARDEFRYDGGIVVGKERSYMDDNQRVFLIDDFTQDGLITKKQHCPQGRPCEVYVDDMRSPIPPNSLLFYR